MPLGVKLNGYMALNCSLFFSYLLNILFRIHYEKHYGHSKTNNVWSIPYRACIWVREMGI